ncbi:MAG: hypothetical protein ACRECV_01375 [Xanthobacteraceae bacterium]
MSTESTAWRADSMAGPSDEFAAYIAAERVTCATIVRGSNIELQ